MDLKEKLGFGAPQTKKQRNAERSRLIRYINLQMIANELPPPLHEKETEFADLVKGLLANYHEKARMLRDVPAPVDSRIETFLNDYFSDLDVGPLQLPRESFVLDRHGVARELSLPVHGNKFESELVESYRLENGVLNNPRSDRRTTKGTFHVCEGGLPIAGDKLSVPKLTFARMFKIAMNPPKEFLELPYTSQHEDKAYTFVSLLLRPIVCPEVPGYTPEKTMEVRFYVPGQLVSNLDFVESIFGNAGDPFIPKNDAALDVEHWTGHTGCVILAPQLVGVTKKELGLPHFDDATPRQRQDGMCYKDESEKYNNGQAFKATCRDERGVVVTIIADNYYGYCKKEVKTQLSYAANLYGNVEEEHAGGVVAYTSWNLGEDFRVNSQRYNGRTIDDVARDYGEWIDMQPEGYGIDKNHPDIVYIPEDARATMVEQRIKWTREGKERSIPLLPGKIYVAPSGYKIRMEKHPAAPSWRLIGTTAEGVNCHKPCTVSGGGKSEISKSATDYMLYGPIFVSDIDKDLALIDEIFHHDYSDRWADDSQIKPNYAERPSRKILSPERSLGSVIKLLTPASDYTDKYNEWLASIPNHIYSMLFIIKRFQQPDWDHNWRANFSVDIVNGTPGHELKYRDRTLVGTYLRVGLSETQQWRTYKLRQDFYAADKVQTEDDITASVVVPAKAIFNLDPQLNADSYKFLTNCEYRLFQRPDDAVHRGLDKQTELDMSQPGNFISNFAPLSREDVAAMAEQIAEFDRFTAPMQNFLREFLDDDQTPSEYAVCSANPRIVDGAPTKNPRYLQTRPDMANPIFRYVGEVGTRLYRKIPAHQPVPTPVNAVLCGRRNNPPDAAAGIRSLAVYGPIHYQELPELFMDFVCSLTGKSPSTTGAGSEGALTKGPFNALRPAADLNNALVSYILTGLAGYSTAAGYIGPNVRVDHDISLLIPEIWCRLTPEERDPKFLIGEGMLEKINDFTHNGELIPASRLGFRITRRFVRTFFGRVFDNPLKVFDDSILRPETQDPESYADGIKHIVEAQQRVAQRHLDDGSIEEACPPLKALLMIMAEGSYEGKTASDPEIRQMFTKDYLLASDWYQKRLATKKLRDTALWKRHVAALDKFAADSRNAESVKELNLAARREYAAAQLAMTENDDYLDALKGTLGAHPFE
ncbi:hypothetical protein LOC68_23530 [Blastopirellula sp. JC732]|uniref:PPi-type phosphoenolpyruvate carboxykinase lobe 2 domain-containing protein n=1 Tax=Blastopirellula sediminis TaxID=2894196 RepID=A0A9X1SIK9_9BACT|nr:hypothetical protein [Blastopirellula sediminis]MCC9605323.1 hypothetical protein [Blastopirellula sediminis]MCC9631377.1 hypothetical protein [Blastopirellula sediminis]